jgi:hypothetical protein
MENNQVSSIDLSVCSECTAGGKLGENLVIVTGSHQSDDLQIVSGLIVIDHSYLYVGCVGTIPVDPVGGLVG